MHTRLTGNLSSPYKLIITQWLCICDSVGHSADACVRTASPVNATTVIPHGDRETEVGMDGVALEGVRVGVCNMYRVCCQVIDR